MLANLECSVDTVVLFMWMTRMWFSEFIHRCHQQNVSDGANTMKRLAIHKLRDRYFTPIFYTTYSAQFAHDYRLLCFQMYFRTRTGTIEPTKSHKVALINHSAILHLSRSIGVNGYVRNRFCPLSSLPLSLFLCARQYRTVQAGTWTCKMQLGACIWMFVTFRILRSVFHILRYARQYISNLWDSMLILYYFAAPACTHKLQTGKPS